jgi:hypothetical protein
MTQALTLEVGKVYLAKNGLIVKIHRELTEESKKQYREATYFESPHWKNAAFGSDENGTSGRYIYTADGHVCIECEADLGLDLVEEITDVNDQ